MLLWEIGGVRFAFTLGLVLAAKSILAVSHPESSTDNNFPIVLIDDEPVVPTAEDDHSEVHCVNITVTSETYLSLGERIQNITGNMSTKCLDIQVLESLTLSTPIQLERLEFQQVNLRGACVSEDGDPIACTLDGQNSTTLLSIVDVSSIHVKDLKFINGHSTGNGAAVYAADSSVHIDSCSFQHNRALGNGGAIYYAVGDSNQMGSTESDQGAFLMQLTSLDVSYNTANMGGAIYFEQSATDYADALVTGCHISGNIAESGGGIAAVGLESLTILSSTLSNNSASYVGGGLFLYEIGSVNVTDNTNITGNQAKAEGSGTNTKSSRGAGIATITSSSCISGLHVFSNVRIYQNSVDGHGGGIYVQLLGSIYVFMLGRNVLEENSATGDGGGFWMGNPGSDEMIADSLAKRFEGIFPSNNQTQNECAHHSYHPYLKIAPVDKSHASEDYLVVRGNTAGQFGGGLCLQGDNWVIDPVTNVDFSYNVAGVGFESSNVYSMAPEEIPSGGAVFVNVSRSEYKNGHFVYCSFVGNSAYNGGAVASLPTNLEISICVFEENYAYLEGGAVHSMLGCLDGCTMLSNTFTNNSAGIRGGAVAVVADVPQCEYATLFEDSGSIWSNAGLSLTAVTMESNKIDWTLSPFTNMSVSLIDEDPFQFGAGGSVYTSGIFSIKIAHSSITGSRALFGGSCFFSRFQEVKILGNNSIQDSKAYGRGGGIFFEKCAPLGIFSSCLYMNSMNISSSSAMLGGGTYISVDTSNTGQQNYEFFNTVVSNCTAHIAGGGFLAAGSAHLLINDSEITSNEVACTHRLAKDELLSPSTLETAMVHAGYVKGNDETLGSTFVASSPEDVFPETLHFVAGTRYSCNDADKCGTIGGGGGLAMVGDNEVRLFNSNIHGNSAYGGSGNNVLVFKDDGVFIENDPHGCDAVLWEKKNGPATEDIFMSQGTPSGLQELVTHSLKLTLKLVDSPVTIPYSTWSRGESTLRISFPRSDSYCMQNLQNAYCWNSSPFVYAICNGEVSATFSVADIQLGEMDNYILPLTQMSNSTTLGECDLRLTLSGGLDSCDPIQISVDGHIVIADSVGCSSKNLCFNSGEIVMFALLAVIPFIGLAALLWRYYRSKQRREIIAEFQSSIGTAQGTPPNKLIIVETDICGSGRLDGGANGQVIDIIKKLIQDAREETPGDHWDIAINGDGATIAFIHCVPALAFAKILTHKLTHFPGWPQSLEQSDDTKTIRDTDGTILFRGPRVRIGISCGKDIIRVIDTNQMECSGPVARNAKILCDFAGNGEIWCCSSVFSGRSVTEYFKKNFVGEHVAEISIGNDDARRLTVIRIHPNEFQGRRACSSGANDKGAEIRRTRKPGVECILVPDLSSFSESSVAVTIAIPRSKAATRHLEELRNAIQRFSHAEEFKKYSAYNYSTGELLELRDNMLQALPARLVFLLPALGEAAAFVIEMGNRIKGIAEDHIKFGLGLSQGSISWVDVSKDVENLFLPQLSGRALDLSDSAASYSIRASSASVSLFNKCRWCTRIVRSGPRQYDAVEYFRSDIEDCLTCEPCRREHEESQEEMSLSPFLAFEIENGDSEYHRSQ